jgi:glutamate N-acetyltransferase/amino-acid N-acetyltransferase
VSVTAVSGFTAAGVSAGIKADGALDLAVVATDDGQPVDAAGVFTRNRMTAAPVTVSRAHLRSTAGRAAAVVLNSGNANAGTGEPGIEDAEAMCAGVAVELGQNPRHVLVCSTGLIGYRLPMPAIEGAVPGLMAARRSDGGADAAEAIRTTDTVRKEAVAHGVGFTVGGMAKGAAMLAPNMATMLAVLTTDAAAEPAVLHRLLYEACQVSFNAMSIDGCTSTNDTVLLLANGRAGRVESGAVDERALARGLAEVCTSLAEQMVGDAEGATKVVRLTVTGAVDDDEAARAARKVAESQLVKCSWYGQDPYWGRIASELGSSGSHFDPRLLTITYGGVTVSHAGVEVDHDRGAVREHMAERTLEIGCDLGLGAGRAHILTNDLTHAYIDENMGTS